MICVAMAQQIKLVFRREQNIYFSCLSTCIQSFSYVSARIVFNDNDPFIVYISHNRAANSN